MKVHTLHRTQTLPIAIDEAWAFFSSPRNLEEICPAYMQFRILTELTGAPIYNGMRINYSVRPLMGIPMRWRTIIEEVQAPYVFVDRQEKGPYALWIHKHTFTAIDGGVLMTDEVNYALPYSLLGDLMHALVVKKKLENIFDFRREKLISLFGS